MYTYLIDSPGLFTKEKLKAYKSLQAYNYYIMYISIVWMYYNCYLNSGWVQTVWFFIIPDTGNCLLRAKVKPSQRLSDKPHEAWIALNKGNGDIINAHCSFMARLVIKQIIFVNLWIILVSVRHVLM